MAVQIPDPGTGNGQTGDNEYVFRKKVRDNFSDQNNAASREVGTDAGDVMQVGAFGLGGEAETDNSSTSTLEFIQRLQQNGSQFFRCNQPIDGVRRYSAGIYAQTYNTYAAISAEYRGLGISVIAGQHDNFVIYDLYHSASKEIYDTTTASGANVVVDNTGKLMRSTSSERYKDVIADLELDDAAYANAMQLAPIVYRSAADADNPAYHYYSFSAEALGAYDPAFTLWRETETVTDDEGNVTEQPLDERVAEGINLNAIVAFLHATNIKQGKIVADLEQRVAALEAAQGV